MKKATSMLLACLLALACVGVAAPTAQAAALVTLSVTPSPDALYSAGTVDLHVSISVGSSSSGDAITDISLYLEGGDTPIGSWSRVAAGKTELFTINSLFVPGSYLGMPFPLVLRYRDFDGAERSLNGSFTVLQGAPAAPNEARLVFLRTASVRNATIGETVNFIYSLRNEGLVEITNITISDELVGDVANIASLSAGQREEYILPQTALRDLTSIPKITYTNAATGQRAEAVIEPLTVPIANPKLTVNLKTDVTMIKTGDTVTLNCTVYNEGNVTFQDIQISDDSLGMLTGVSVLEPGKSYVTTKKVVPANSVDYTFLVAAKDLEGKSISLKSNTIGIVVEDAPATNAPSQTLSLRALPNSSLLDEPGEVTFTITVTNISEAPVQDLTLSEMSAGVLQKMDTMPMGDKVFLYSTRVEADRTFSFTVEGITSEGVRVQAAADDIIVALRQGAEMTPTVSATPIPSADSQPADSQPGAADAPSGGNRLLLLALVVVGLLIVVCVAVLILLFVRERNRRAEEDARAYAQPAQDSFYEAYPQPGDDYAPITAPPGSDEDQVTRPVAPRGRESDDVQTRPVRPKHRR